MRTNHKQNKSFKNIIIIIVLIILFACSVLFVLEKLQIINLINSSNPNTKNSSQKIDYNPPTQEQIDAGVKQPDVQTNNNLGISITYINTSSDPVKIGSVINGVASNNGVCTLKLTKESAEIIKTADTYALPSTSTCKGFDINKSELSNGTWQLSLTVIIGDKESSINDSFTLD